LLLVYSFLF